MIEQKGKIKIVLHSKKRLYPHIYISTGGKDIQKHIFCVYLYDLH